MPSTRRLEAIREDDHYSGVRVTLGGELSRASIRLHVDINAGDPIWPEPLQVRLPRLLDGTLLIRGRPLDMVFDRTPETSPAIHDETSMCRRLTSS